VFTQETATGPYPEPDETRPHQHKCLRSAPIPSSSVSLRFPVTSSNVTSVFFACLPHECYVTRPPHKPSRTTCPLFQSVIATRTATSSLDTKQTFTHKVTSSSVSASRCVCYKRKYFVTPPNQLFSIRCFIFHYMLRPLTIGSSSGATRLQNVSLLNRYAHISSNLDPYVHNISKM
jgi:hypothetical protein